MPCAFAKILKEKEISRSRFLDIFNLRTPTRLKVDYSVLANVSPSTKCVSAANAVCRNRDIFNAHYVFR